jgi:hypothetical protein
MTQDADPDETLLVPAELRASFLPVRPPSSHRAAAPPAANAIERQLAPRPQWNQAVTKKAIAELWPNGISEDLVNGQIKQRVGEQLKRMGAPPASPTTWMDSMLKLHRV